MDDAAPKIDMVQVKKQGYDSLLLADQGTRQSLTEEDPFEPDD